MMFNLLDTVRLKATENTYGVPAGTLGTIVDIQGNGEAYTVEFVDDEGNTYEEALFACFTGDDLEKA